MLNLQSMYKELQDTLHTNIRTLSNPYIYGWGVLGILIASALWIIDYIVSLLQIHVTEPDLKFLSEPIVITIPFFVVFLAGCANFVGMQLNSHPQTVWIFLHKKLKQLAYDLWWATICYVAGLAMVYTLVMPGLPTSVVSAFTNLAWGLVLFEVLAKVSNKTPSTCISRIGSKWIKRITTAVVVLLFWCIFVAVLTIPFLLD